MNLVENLLLLTLVYIILRVNQSCYVGSLRRTCPGGVMVFKITAQMSLKQTCAHCARVMAILIGGRTHKAQMKKQVYTGLPLIGTAVPIVEKCIANQ